MASKVKTQPVTTLSAKEELAQLRARIAGKKAAESVSKEPIVVTEVIGKGIDQLDRFGHATAEVVAGDNNVFTRINLGRMKAKEARGGYATNK